MKDISVLFADLVKRVANESNQASAMHHSMAMREFLLLNFSTDELHALAVEFKNLSLELEKEVSDGGLDDQVLLISLLPDLFKADGDLEELGEEAVMILTNLTVEYLMKTEPNEYNQLTMEEFIQIYSELRPSVEAVLGGGESYTPITFEKYSLYLKAIDEMKTNREKIQNGDLESLKPLYSAELIDVEPAINDLYEFTLKFRYDVALIWAIRKRLLKIEPVVENGVPVDWEMEIAPHMSESVKLMLDDTLKTKED